MTASSLSLLAANVAAWALLDYASHVFRAVVRVPFRSFGAELPALTRFLFMGPAAAYHAVYLGIALLLVVKEFRTKDPWVALSINGISGVGCAYVLLLHLYAAVLPMFMGTLAH